MPVTATARLLLAAGLLLFATLSAGAAPATRPSTRPASRPAYPDARVDAAVQASYRAVHAGWSADEVLTQPRLRARFRAACRERLPGVDPERCAWALLNLRKAGELTAEVTERRRTDYDGVIPAAEIAARLLRNRHRATLDRILCDPRLLAAFDRIAGRIAPEASRYRLRKAALKLRKARRLRPELVARIAEWGRTISVADAAALRREPERIPSRPGIYVFRDETGYLYVGESANLRRRVSAHLDRAGQAGLAAYLERRGVADVRVELHAFDGDSPARRVAVRRAYESELIRKREPRLNLQP